MTLIPFLLDYTIETICCGNRSECARRMGMSYAELKDIRKRINEGKNSYRLIEALLEMYWKEELSLDEAFRSYSESCFGAAIEKRREDCLKIKEAFKYPLECFSRWEKHSGQLAHLSQAFLRQIEMIFCEEYCSRERYADDKCPVKCFLEYISWIRGEMQANNSILSVAAAANTPEVEHNIHSQFSGIPGIVTGGKQGE